jgi:hypothetical protein
VTNPRPNRRLEETGHHLQTTIATLTTTAYNHINRELALLDGWRAGTPEVAVNSTSELTPVEATADQRLRLTIARTHLDRQIDALLVNTRDLAELLRDIMRMRVPKTATQPAAIKLCRDALAGRDGNLEWGDPMCLRTADKSGLCHAHYMAWYRWRNLHGIDTSRDFQPIDRAS